MVQQVTERISLHEAVEASLRIRLVEVERERDAYLRQLTDSQTSLRAAKLVEESMMGRLQRTITQYEAKLDDMEERLETTQEIEKTLMDQVAQLRIRDRETKQQLQRSRKMTSHLISRLHESDIHDPFDGLDIPEVLQHLNNFSNPPPSP